MEKLCFKCNVVKSITEFYKHKATKDGYLNKCKACAIADSKNYREKNIEEIRQKDIDRSHESKRHGYRVQYARSYKLNNPIKANAHRLLEKAVWNGEIIKPNKCDECGEEKDFIVGHHENYKKPLEVSWLCAKCHAAIHLRRDNFKEVKHG